MTLWLLLAALTVAVLALLLRPLLRAAPQPVGGRADYDLAVHRDQLREIEQDRDRGLLTEAQAAATRLEVQRRMLQAAEGKPGKSVIRMRRPGIAAAALAVTLSLGAFALYARLGAPELPGQPYVERQAARLGLPEDQAHQMLEMVERLAARLEQQPNDLAGWQMLGRSYKALGRNDEAVAALARAIDLGARDAETWSAHGEALTMVSAGEVAPAVESFRNALRAAPGEPRAMFYLGLAQAQRGDDRGAIAIWRQLAATAPADAPWLAAVREQITAAAARVGVDPATVTPAAPDVGGPPAPVAGTGPAPDVGAMVARLAERLAQNPDDFDGWLRLARSYRVMGEPAKAKEAYEQAIKLKPGDVAAKLAYAESLLDQVPDGSNQVPPQVLALMREINRLAPDNMDALFYIGLGEAQAGNAGEARAVWTRLAGMLPSNSPERQALQEQIDGLAR